ncbi:hypothetical protein, partial [Enterobacter hormaechei]
CKRFQTLPGGGGGVTRRKKHKNRMGGYGKPPPHIKKATTNRGPFNLIGLEYLTTSLLLKKFPCHH